MCRCHFTINKGNGLCSTILIRFRIEEDLLGQLEIPASAYYGIHSLRAYQNFNISSMKISDVPEFVRGMVFTKKAAAKANAELGTIPSDVGKYIVEACDLILDTGKMHGSVSSLMYTKAARVLQST